MSALVLDIGGSSTRAGYAGDDTPKALFPTYYGFTVEDEPVDEQAAETEQPPARKKRVNIHLGEQKGPSTWRPGMEVSNPIRESMSELRDHSSG